MADDAIKPAPGPDPPPIPVPLVTLNTPTAVGPDAATSPARGPDQPPIPVRLVTLNTQHGVGPDERHDLPRLATLLASADADVICLQEVDRRFDGRSEDV